METFGALTKEARKFLQQVADYLAGEDTAF